MTTRQEPSPTRTGPGRRIAERILGIVGGISTFLGLFILFAGEDQWLGISGDVSWRVGDISSAWGYGLLIGGVVLLLIVLGMVISGSRTAHRPTTRELQPH